MIKSLEEDDLTDDPEWFPGGDAPRPARQPHVMAHNSGGQPTVVLQTADHGTHVRPASMVVKGFVSKRERKKNTLIRSVMNVAFI